MHIPSLRSFWDQLRRPILPHAQGRYRCDPGRPQLLILVEGRHDIEFLCRMAKVVRTNHPQVPDLRQLEIASRLIFIPAGGNDFRLWQSRLAPFGCSEFHLYDRDLPPEADRRIAWANSVSQRPDCRAFVTQKRSLENYLHPAAIQAVQGVTISFGDFDDLPSLVAQARLAQWKDIPWELLSLRTRRRMRDRAKGWLNTLAVDAMNCRLLAERKSLEELILWFGTITTLLARAR